jgi:hypothetical protein
MLTCVYGPSGPTSIFHFRSFFHRAFSFSPVLINHRPLVGINLIIVNASNMDFDSAFEYYLHLQDLAYHSMDAAEAKRAYREKRDPNWQ